MNERIKKLAEQAGFQYIKDEGIGWAGNYNDSLPKFAELIVRECADICNKIYHSNYPDAEEWERSEEGDVIKQHFGVRE